MGRSSDNDLSFPSDMSLSRHHLAPEKADDGWYVEDLGAKNRTMLNGRRIDGKTLLTSGDRISAGQVVVIFGGTKASTGPVEFTVGGDESPLRATVMTNLRGVLSRESTMPGLVRPSSVRTESGIPLDHPAVARADRAGQELADTAHWTSSSELILDLSISAVGAERGVLMTPRRGRPRGSRGSRRGFRISSTVRDRVIKESASLARARYGARRRLQVPGQHRRPAGAERDGGAAPDERPRDRARERRLSLVRPSVSPPTTSTF